MKDQDANSPGGKSPSVVRSLGNVFISSARGWLSLFAAAGLVGSVSNDEERKDEEDARSRLERLDVVARAYDARHPTASFSFRVGRAEAPVGPSVVPPKLK